MNLTLIDPFQLHAELPEVIEDKLELKDQEIVVCAFSRRGNLLAGGCRGGSVVVWDFDTHGVARTFEGHAGCVTAVAWTRSSRRLFSAAADGGLVLWEVLSGERTHAVSLGVPIGLAALHPRKRDLCVACTQSQGGAAGAVVLQHLQKPEQRVSLLPPDVQAAEDAASAAGKRGDMVACFDLLGERVLVGTARGGVHVVSLGGQVLASLQVAGGAAIKSIELGRNGTRFVINSSDRMVRLFALERVLEGNRAPLRELQDVVNRVQWTHASLTADSEHVIASSSSQTEQHLYIWDLHGHLTKTLEGPKDGGIYFTSHPSRPILACCARSGGLFVWTKQYAENWSAFAPDFKELEENEEYEEREDEFDIKEVQEAKVDDPADELIDVVTVERSEVAHVPDADDDDAELLFIPTVPTADDDADGGGSSMDTGDDFAKAKKRKPSAADGAGGRAGKRAA